MSCSAARQIQPLPRWATCFAKTCPCTALEDLQRQRGHRAPIRARHQRPTTPHQSNGRRLCAKSLSELGFDARRLIGHRKPDLADRTNPSRLLADQSFGSKNRRLRERKLAARRHTPSPKANRAVRRCRRAFWSRSVERPAIAQNRASSPRCDAARYSAIRRPV